MIFESHAHYDDERYDKDRQAILKSLKSNDVGYVINVGASLSSSRASIELAKRYPFVYASVGVHPHEVGSMKEDDLELLLLMAAHEKVVAIGEIGLDYYYDLAPRSVQKLWFREQLRLARDLEMPVIIHSRDACQDTFDILTEEEYSPKNAVIHCFSGSKEMALEYVKRGYFIGIGGVVTFSNAKKLVEVTRAIPLSHILIETDAPYLTPNPHRGKRNDSKYLVDVIKEIAVIKNISPQEVEEVTFENGKRFFFPEE